MRGHALVARRTLAWPWALGVVELHQEGGPRLPVVIHDDDYVIAGEVSLFLGWLRENVGENGVASFFGINRGWLPENHVAVFSALCRRLGLRAEYDAGTLNRLLIGRTDESPPLDRDALDRLAELVTTFAEGETWRRW